MITLDIGQYSVLMDTYIKLGHDLRFKSKTTPSLKKLSALLGKSFKTKKEAFSFIHDLLEYNKEKTFDICGMGDCPAIEKNGIADKSIGTWWVSWETPNGAMSEPKKLCQDCKDFLVSVNCIGEEVKEGNNG